MQAVRINYVIAAWSGPRRGIFIPYEQDRTWFLRKHIEQLSVLDHNLSQITIVIAENESEDKNFSDYIKQIPKRIKNAEVIVKRRPNRGISYGAFCAAYAMTRDYFDYYIFIEDDYSFTEDNFDIKLINKLNSLPNCSYLCGLVKNNHAAIPHGIASTKSLERVWQQYGCLPCIPPKSDKADYGDLVQLAFSEGFTSIGAVYDTQDEYSAPYLETSGLVTVYGNIYKPPLIIPLQIIDMCTKTEQVKESVTPAVLNNQQSGIQTQSEIQKQPTIEYPWYKIWYRRICGR